MITATEGRQLTDLIDRGHALPSNWYTDQSLFKGENDRILRRSWHYVTHTGSLAEVGEQFLDRKSVV